MPSLLKIFSFSDMYGGATKQCWQLHLLHSTNLIKIYHQKTARAISGLWQTWNIGCQPQIRLEMLVSEKVITATRIKCMYNFTFRQLWFLAESWHWRNLCSAFADALTSVCCRSDTQHGHDKGQRWPTFWEKPWANVNLMGHEERRKAPLKAWRFVQGIKRIVVLCSSKRGEKLQNATTEIINASHSLKPPTGGLATFFSPQRKNVK